MFECLGRCVESVVKLGKAALPTIYLLSGREMEEKMAHGIIV